MPSILTITFSPSIDISSSVPALIASKKLKCSVPKREPGGGGINVARAIKKLGGLASAVFPVGGCTGSILGRMMAKDEVPSIPIEVRNETRENLVILEESTNRQFRFGMPGTKLAEDEWQQILKRVEVTRDLKYIVASGSLPPGVPADIFCRLAEISAKKKARFIADASGDALRQLSGHGVYLIKPNLGELSSLSGSTYLQPSQVASSAQRIISEGKSEVVVVSMGSEGALLVTDTTIRRFTPPHVPIRSTVGAGDSMVAGIVLALSEGNTIEDSVRYGVACGTAATMNPGTELCRLEDAERLYKEIISKD